MFQVLRTNGIRPGDVANELGVTADEMGRKFFGLTAASPDGEEGAAGDHHAKGLLSLVH
ncbi:hypothetical protein ABK046_30480 [Streptomyces caeruleatus]